jgi:predicted metal-dependent phosphoesterase TrpH
VARIELHLHTAEHSRCGKDAARDMVRRAYKRGLDGVALTDHHYLWSDAEVAELRRRSAVPRSFSIIPGQECTTSNVGDVLVFGPRAVLRPGTSVGAIRKQYPNAAIVVAHPYRYGRPTDRLLMHPAVDAIEILNPNHSPRAIQVAMQDWWRLGFVATAGSDAHRLDHIGVYPTLFDHQPRSVRGLVNELRAGRCGFSMPQGLIAGAGATTKRRPGRLQPVSIR